MMRIETATAQIQATAFAIQTTTTAQIRGAVGDSYVCAHGHMSPRVSDENVLAFLGSNPALLSNLPLHIQLPERLVYMSYITLQVGKIETLFQSLASRGSYPIEEPDSWHLRPFRSSTWLKPSTDEEIKDVQSNVFALIVKIEESLKIRDNRPSIQRGAYAMSSLSVWLSHLEMDQESFKIVHFAVDLYRTLNKTNEDVYGPHLVRALCQMCSCYINTGDVIKAYTVITEAVTLGRRLADASPTFEARMQLARSVSVSAKVGCRNGDWMNALKDAEEAVQSYQLLIGNPESMLRAGVGIVKGRRMTSEGTHVLEYASALTNLHHSLSMSMRHNESVKAGIQALELYRGLEQRHSNGTFSADIAHLCSSLASDKCGETVPVDQALLHARESVYHYEKMLQNTGVISHNLPYALGLEIKLLSKLENFDEAYEVCQKLERMIQIQMDDQKLRAQSYLQLIQNFVLSERYSEAALTGELLLTMYRSLLSDEDLVTAYALTSTAFAVMNDYCKSIKVAEASVTHWRIVTLQDPKYLQYVARSIVILARGYFLTKNYERAFKEGGEALKLFSIVITEDPGLLKDYMKTLELNIEIAEEAKMELESLERSRLVVQYSRTLVKQFPAKQLALIRRIRDHALLLEAFDHLADATVAISEALDWFDAHPAQDPQSAGLHIFCLLTSARLLCLQGHPSRALSLHEKANAIGQPFLDVPFVAQNILWGMAYNLLALYLMGQISLACSETDVCLKFASEHNLEKGITYIFCLDTVSRLYRCDGRLNDALPIIRRSIALHKAYDGTSSSWALSNLLADAGQEAEAVTVAHKAMRETEKWMNSSNTFEKECHVQAQYSLALRHFANGELAQAQKLLVQVRSFYHEHSKAINIWFIDLAMTLWALGNVECASGRQKEGIMAITELNKLRKRLQLLFPSLADLVEVGLNRERNFAAWKRLLEKYDISCGHQDEEDVSEGNMESSDSLCARIASLDHVLATNNSAK